MTSERLTLQDLVDLLSDRQNITKKDTETFLRELVDLISETISENDFVRIKDFGTFKLTKVNSRRSVNVNTGDTIEIPAHYKLSFVPDKVLREGVNKPFSHFESVLVDNEVQFEDKEKPKKEDKAEVKAATVKKAIKEEKPKQNIKVEKVIKEEVEQLATNDLLTEEIEEQMEEEVLETTPLPPKKKKAKKEKEEIILKEEEGEEEDNEVDDIAYNKYLAKRRKKRNTWMAILAILLLLSFAGYWAYNNLSIEITPRSASTEASNSEPIKVAEEPRKTSEEPAEKVETLASTDPSATPEKPVEPAVATPTTSTPPIQEAGQEIIVPAKATMRLLGEKYYGHISFWVYIFDENRDKLNKPDELFAGMKLKIPPASKYGIDANDPASVKKAQQYEDKLFSQFGRE